MGLTLYAAYLYNLTPPRDLPEVLKFLLSGVVGYVFAYVPAGKAVTAAERDRSTVFESDAVLQQSIAAFQQQKEIYERRIDNLTKYIERLGPENEAGEEVKIDGEKG